MLFAIIIDGYRPLKSNTVMLSYIPASGVFTYAPTIGLMFLAPISSSLGLFEMISLFHVAYFISRYSTSWPVVDIAVSARVVPETFETSISSGMKKS